MQTACRAAVAVLYKPGLISVSFPRAAKGADIIMERGKRESVEVICPRCRYTLIVTLPVADLPRCPQCKTRMSISELLDEGKSY